MLRENRIYHIDEMQQKSLKEIAFIGRSNVGKSSLLNCILGCKIAKVSKTPGTTLWLGIHRLKNCYIIDMPGYGYAKTPENRKQLVNQLVDDYLHSGRVDLVLMLVDLRHGLKSIDLNIISKLEKMGTIPEIKIVGTKSDTKEAKNFNFEFKVSSRTLDGIDLLKSAITRL